MLNWKKERHAKRGKSKKFIGEVEMKFLANE